MNTSSMSAYLDGYKNSYEDGKKINKPIFEWQKCQRKNGTEFLKLIYYSNSAGGYVEVGRFNMSKHEFIQNEWSMEEIFKELK